jgi:hypothetical protein
MPMTPPLTPAQKQKRYRDKKKGVTTVTVLPDGNEIVTGSPSKLNPGRMLARSIPDEVLPNGDILTVVPPRVAPGESIPDATSQLEDHLRSRKARQEAGAQVVRTPPTTYVDSAGIVITVEDSALVPRVTVDSSPLTAEEYLSQGCPPVGPPPRGVRIVDIAQCSVEQIKAVPGAWIEPGHSEQREAPAPKKKFR